MNDEVAKAGKTSRANFPWLPAYPAGVPARIETPPYNVLGEIAPDLAERRPAARLKLPPSVQQETGSAPPSQPIALLARRSLIRCALKVSDGLSLDRGRHLFFARRSFKAALSRIASELFRPGCLYVSSVSAIRPAYVEDQGLKRHRDVAFWPLPCELPQYSRHNALGLP
jgi:hypothetical protein